MTSTTAQTDPSTPPLSWRSREVQLIVLVALGLRLLWGVLIPCIPSSDCVAYDTFAQNLVNHGTFGFHPNEPSAFWAPGTSFIIAAMYKVFGIAFFPVVVLNIILGSISVYLTIRLADTLLSRIPALVAGAILALWPVHIQLTSVLSSELPFTTILLGGTLAWVTLREKPLWRAVLAGVLFAFAVYIRATAILIPPVLAGLEFLFMPRRGRTFVTALGLGLLMAAIIAPWTYRNYTLYHDLVPISANNGTNFWMGNNPATNGNYQEPPTFPELNQAQIDRELMRRATDYIKQDPGAFVKRTALKFVLQHGPQTIGVVWNKDALRPRIGETGMKILKGLSTAYWFAAIAGALVGIILLFREVGPLKTFTNPILVIWVYFALLHAIYVIQDRYIIPATPFVACLAGVSIGVFLDFYRERRSFNRTKAIAA